MTPTRLKNEVRSEGFDYRLTSLRPPSEDHLPPPHHIMGDECSECEWPIHSMGIGRQRNGHDNKDYKATLFRSRSVDDYTLPRDKLHQGPERRVQLQVIVILFG